MVSTGGPAQLLFTPADADDLALFLRHLPVEVPVLVIGLGSNMLVRDGGVPGAVIRLGKGFGGIAIEDGHRVRAGAAAADVKVARAAAEAGIDGLAFLRGIPGTVGGALRMNGGAYGGDVAQVLVEAQAVDRAGNRVTLTHADMGFTYRHTAVPTISFSWKRCLPARPANRPRFRAHERHHRSPVHDTAGQHPHGRLHLHQPSRWQGVGTGGRCRLPGLQIGAAQVSELHCNFLLNLGGATAADIEALGEEVRRRVREHFGIELQWEIRRVGIPLSADGS